MSKIRSFKPKQHKIVSSVREEVGNVNYFIKDAPQDTLNTDVLNPTATFQSGDLKVIPLGGVGDVTKNMFVYEYKDDIIIIDCGVSFPTEDQPGVDLVIPDISYLRDKKDKIRGIVITHGHDDHIGALPYLWTDLGSPNIYSQKLTIGFIRNKFTEHNLSKDGLKVLSIDDKIKLGSFDISFYQASHSVPDTTGIVMKTPIGTLIHQSDFKIDWTPVNGQVTDVGTVASLGKEGVLLMTLDCLRSDKPGFNPSERTIQPTFERIEAETKGKLLITLITSNITRMQQAINVAVKSGRKLALSGRSMESNFQVARDLGYLDVPAGLIIAQEEIRRFPDNKLMILIAGSFGQSGSALDRVANNDHKYVFLKKDDTVVFSADPMPAAEENQGDLIDAITRQGINVIYSTATSDLHVSGHAAAEELKVMVNLAKPKYLMPIGGNFKHIKVFSNMVEPMGYDSSRVITPKIVQAININRESFSYGEQIPTSNVYVDGLGVGDVGTVVLRDRQVMSEEGVVIVVIQFDKHHGNIIGDIDMLSRGFVFEKASEDLLNQAKELVKKNFSETQASFDWKYTRGKIEKSLEKFFYVETKRNPLIIPLVVEI
jgi:ribonuclease J